MIRPAEKSCRGAVLTTEKLASAGNLIESGRMIEMRRSAENILIEGPAGQLEGILESRRDTRPTALAVVCHPHPAHGGTMHNKVVHTVARAFVGQGFAVLRFNFRGTGQSDGEYDAGHGELSDALAAVQWMRQREAELPMWLAGFSFGAVIAVRAALECEPAGLVSIAPAFSRLANSMDAQPGCPWLIIHGDEDELVDIDETIEWINRLEPGPELAVFSETTHFFHGKLTQLRDVVENFVRVNS